MRIVVAALAVVVGWGLTARADDKPYESKEGKFRIVFPAGSKAPTTEKPKKSKDVDMYATRAETPDGKVCVVIYMDIKDLKPDQEEIIFNSAIAKSKKDADTVSVSDKKEFGKDGKLTGREFLMTFKDKRQMKTRVIIDGTRVYTLLIGDVKTGYAITPDADKVLDSFEVVK